ncbi:VF530 family protein [Myroides sp. JBRI-B21084]|uniref:VF530 family protein n=1 Tax=Myroides sp. JBRI-B21084 TaxID=3119977 RepID=UPI0026E394AC|nr:VF530 family protein [Paenimyroides cloacae]WKW45908.1 VF530 family protein [Paenimyroides cloacae]
MAHNDPLHGMTLQKILEELVAFFEGWETLSKEIPINCFTKNPSIKSSLTFLRKTPWAREKVERLYVKVYPFLQKNKK